MQIIICKQTEELGPKNSILYSLENLPKSFLDEVIFIPFTYPVHALF